MSSITTERRQERSENRLGLQEDHGYIWGVQGNPRRMAGVNGAEPLAGGGAEGATFYGIMVPWRPHDASNAVEGRNSLT